MKLNNVLLTLIISVVIFILALSLNYFVFDKIVVTNVEYNLSCPTPRINLSCPEISCGEVYVTPRLVEFSHRRVGDLDKLERIPIHGNSMVNTFADGNTLLGIVSNDVLAGDIICYKGGDSFGVDMICHRVQSIYPSGLMLVCGDYNDNCDVINKNQIDYVIVGTLYT